MHSSNSYSFITHVAAKDGDQSSSLVESPDCSFIAFLSIKTILFIFYLLVLFTPNIQTKSVVAEFIIFWLKRGLMLYFDLYVADLLNIGPWSTSFTLILKKYLLVLFASLMHHVSHITCRLSCVTYHMSKYCFTLLKNKENN